MALPRKFLSRAGLSLLAIFALLQCFRPAKNISEDPSADDLRTLYKPPAELHALLRLACYDCHSNNTRYPWYAEIQPFGWLLANHIEDGKGELNFSSLGKLSPKRAHAKLLACSDAISAHEMPLSSYTWIHRDARLTEPQITALTDWLDATADSLE